MGKKQFGSKNGSPKHGVSLLASQRRCHAQDASADDRYRPAAVAGGCGEPQPEPGGPELLYLRSNRGLTVLAAGASEPSFKAYGVPSQNWSTVVQSSYFGKNPKYTKISGVDPDSGETAWEQDIDGRKRVKLVSIDGTHAALGPLRERHFSLGRKQTELTIAGPEAGSKTLTLDGNYEPEAFSTDGKSLFVIRFLPARAPTKYQVRRLEIETGRVVAVYTPDAHLRRAMGGTARVQTASSDGRRLYTLYTIGGGKQGPSYAFVHVLSLDEMSAHCIDLPVEFARDAETATALATSGDGRRLYVANTTSDAIAEIDTQTLSVERTAPVDLDIRGGAHALVDDTNGRIFITSGSLVTVIDAATLEVERSWWMAQRIRGIQVAAEERKVYVGLRRHIAVMDPDDGEQLETLDPPGVGSIEELGPVYETLDQGPLSCAC